MDQALEVVAGNDSGCDYVGWVRARLTQPPPFGAAWSPDHLVLASVGLEDDGEWLVDLHVRLPAASRRVVDLATLVPCVRPLAQLGAMELDWHGARLAGVGVVWAPVEVDAAGATIRGSASVGAWHVTITARWWPHAVATPVDVRVVAADYGMPASVYSLAADLVVTLPDGVLWGPDGNGVVMPRGVPLDHGAERRVAMTAVWPKRMATPQDWSTACALHLRGPWARAR